MAYVVHPLPFKPHRPGGLSDRLLISHYENNYGGAVRRLNAIENRLAALDWAAASVFDLNGLGRETLIAANSTILHEAYFAESLIRRADMLPDARFVAPEAIADWADKLPRDRPVIVYCEYGFQVSGEATAELRRRGFDAGALAGGIAAWHAMGGPTVPLTPEQNKETCDDDMGHA